MSERSALEDGGLGLSWVGFLPLVLAEAYSVQIPNESAVFISHVKREVRCRANRLVAL